MNETKLLNDKRRRFKSKNLVKKTDKLNIMTSPIVVLEKLPIKIEGNLFVQKKMIDSNISNHTADKKTRQYTKINNLKYKKCKRKFTKFKKKNKVTSVYSDKSNSQKLIKGYTKNFVTKEIVNKLKNIQSVSKDNFQLISNLNKCPKVVLERLSSHKLETNAYTGNERVLNKTDVNNKSLDESNKDDIKIKNSTNEDDFKVKPKPESNFISALAICEAMCNKIKNEIEDVDDYLDTDINHCDKESLTKIEKTEVDDQVEYLKTTTVDESNEITEVFVVKKDVDNFIQIGFEKKVDISTGNIVGEEETDNNIQMKFETAIDGNNEVSDNFDTKDVANNIFIESFDNKNDIDIIISEDFINTEENDNVERNENKSNLLSAENIPKKIFDNTSYVDKNIELTMNQEILNNYVKANHDKSITSQEVCYEIKDDINSEKIVDKWLIDECNSSLNINSNAKSITEIEAIIAKDSKLFVFKCLKCNIIQPLNRTKLIIHCKICDSIMYHECLICQKKYRSIYTMYSHMNRKHQDEKNIVNELKKNQLAAIKSSSKESKVKQSDNVTNYLHLLQYHDKRDAKVFRTVSNPITAYCLDCHKQVSATDKTENWCSSCKTKFIFLCNSCKYVRKNYGQVRLHVLRLHAKKILKCPNNCGKSFSYSRNHWDHVKSCQTFPSMRNEDKLIKISNKHIKSYCYKCGQYFESKSSMLEHVNYCGKINPLSCEHCDFKTDSKNALKNHLQTKHMVSVF